MSVDHTHTIIQLKDLSFSYGTNLVLDKINLSIHEGDYLGVIGPNGGGKTTLIKLIVGLLKADSGDITLYDRPIKEFKDWSHLSYIAQKVTNIDLNFPITVRDAVSMGRYGLRRIGQNMTTQDKQIVQESLSQVDLLDYQNRLIGELSGGQLQRVFIARALAQKPAIIFLDEPTVGVDTNTQRQFYALLKKMNQDLGITLVLISHDIDFISQEVTEIAVINKSIIYYPKGAHFTHHTHSL